MTRTGNGDSEYCERLAERELRSPPNDPQFP
jgi:hypothetical protein